MNTEESNTLRVQSGITAGRELSPLEIQREIAGKSPDFIKGALWILRYMVYGDVFFGERGRAAANTIEHEAHRMEII